MLGERFERLVPLPSIAGLPAVRYSEGAFFNYVNHVAAEKRYILEDALPDWKHKASRVKLSDYADLPINFRGQQMTVAEWFSQLKETVGFWSQEAKGMALPDFEETISEFQSLSSTPMSETSETEALMGQRPVPSERTVGRWHKKHDSGIGMEIEKAMGAHGIVV